MWQGVSTTGVSKIGWQRQSQLGDGGVAVRRTIAKAFGLDAATRQMSLFFCLWGDTRADILLV